ncbi:MAG: MBL fold metallo-hydrolase [Planctomycetota bacterium]
MDLRVVSIGTLSAHPLWNERGAVRTGHATSTLIRAGESVILVDPGLPGPAIAARLAERAGITPAQITHVFCTSFRPDVRRGIDAFTDATWLIGERERETVGVPMAQGLARLAETEQANRDTGEDLHEDQQTMREVLERDIAILARCQASPDELAPGVSLFPLPGVTPGLCGLLVSEPTRTTLVCGDAIPTVEHLEAGRVPNDADDAQLAQESFAEAIEIADVLVLGRDNAVANTVRRGF